MKLYSLAITVAVLGLIEGGLWWHDARHDRRGGEAFVDSPLLDVPQIERAHRIVIREKPQSKTIEKDNDGFEVTLVVDKNAPIRETVLERRDADHWIVANCFGLEADPVWLGETLRDLTRGRLTRFVASDPDLMQDLDLNLGAVRLDDDHGAVIRRLEFGRKDGGDTYQFVRVDHGDAFVAKHDAELVGDALSWVAGRIFRFEPTDVKELDLPFAEPGEKPLRLTRSSNRVPFLVDGKPDDAVADLASKRVGQILREPVMVAFAPHDPVVEVARQHIAAHVRIVFFDGREYQVDYGVVPKGDPTVAALKPYDDSTIAFGFWTTSKSDDVLNRQATRAAFAYSRGAVIGILPKNRADLAARAAAAKAATTAEAPATP